jgi:hypothetical protein
MRDRTADIEIGADEGRTAQCDEDAAFPWRLARDGPAHRRANPRRVRAVLGEPSGQRSDQLAIGVKSKNFEADHAAPPEALAVAL